MVASVSSVVYPVVPDVVSGAESDVDSTAVVVGEVGDLDLLVDLSHADPKSPMQTNSAHTGVNNRRPVRACNKLLTERNDINAHSDGRGT